MKKRVILCEDIPALGVVGDIVEVSPGHARNFLFPSGKAMPWSEDAERRIERSAREAEAIRLTQAAEYEVLATKISGMQFTFEEKVNSEGHLYGAVTSKRIHDALLEQGIDLPESHVRLAEPIRAAGEFEVPIHIHAELNTSIMVWVVALKQEGEELDLDALESEGEEPAVSEEAEVAGE